MFPLILCGVLITLVVSTNAGNISENLKVTTTLPILPFKAIPSDQECVPKMKKSEISKIVELFRSDRVHVVDIRLSFSGNGYHQRLLSDLRVKLLNPIGREILYTLEHSELHFVTWTLKAGVRYFKLNVEESHNNCVDRWKSVADFALENMQIIVRSINLPTNYEVWYSFKEIPSGEKRKFCCQITNYNLSQCSDELCSEKNSFLYSDVAQAATIVVVFGSFCLLCGFTWLLFVFLSHTEFNLKYPKYYKLEESLMSPFSILLKTVWEEYGGKISFIRSCLSVGFIFYFSYFQIGMFALPFLLWGPIFTIPCFYKRKITKSCSRMQNKHNDASSIPFFSWQSFVFNADMLREERLCGRKLPSRFGSSFGEFVDVMKQLLPFDLKFWAGMLFHDYITSCVDVHCENRILKILLLCPCYVFEIVISFCFLCIAVVLSVVYVVIVYSFVYLFQLLFLVVSLKYSSIKFPHRLFDLLCLIDLVGLCAFIILSCYVMTSVVQSLVLGLFLNLTYFIPYFALLAVLLFYCGSYWKSMEEKYLVLKRLIYEECRDVQGVNNGCIPNRHPKRDEKVLPVVSKVLYDKIREELLPYHTSLFYFGLKMFWSLIFSYSIFMLINSLHEFNVTGAVQVVTTASLGVIPHIFNMVALKTNDEKKKAWEEKLKLNVKYMVEDLVREYPELARTVLIIQQENNTAANENVQNGSDNRQKNGQLLEMMSGTENDNEQIEEISHQESSV